MIVMMIMSMSVWPNGATGMKLLKMSTEQTARILSEDKVPGFSNVDSCLMIAIV